MTLQRLNKISVYLTLSIALTTLGMTGALSLPMLVVIIAVLAISWRDIAVRQPRQRLQLFWNLFLGVFMLATLLRIGADTREALPAAVQLLLALTFVKLFQRYNARDDLHIHALAFLMVTLSTILSQSILLGALFFFYVLTACMGLALNHLIRTCEHSHGQYHARHVHLTSATIPMFAVSSATMVVASLGFFLLTPRLGLGLFTPINNNTPQALTGFSTNISLDDHGLIGLDDRVVMRVEVDTPIPQPYWRGMAFDLFDGTRWRQTRTVRRRRMLNPDDQTRFGDPPEAPLVTQRIVLEPLGVPVLLGVDQPVRVSFPEDTEARFRQHVSHPHWVQADRAGSLYHRLDPFQPIQYTIESASQRDPNWRVDLDLRERLHYLRVPPDTPERVQQLALSLTEDLTTPVERAEAIADYLRQHHSYTLNLPRRHGDIIDHFLFEDRRGHCEFFSSAMVVLARLSGVQARNVNGFLGGEWNSFGGYFLVRRRHAHSWVEIYDGQRWLTFDPTPAAGRPSSTLADTDNGTLLPAFLDNLQHLWQQWVVQFGSGRQRDLIRQLFGADDNPQDPTPSDGAGPALWNPLSVLMITLVLLALLGWGWAKRRWSPWLLPLSWVILLSLGASLPKTPALLVLLDVLGPLVLYWRFRLVVESPRQSTTPNHTLAPFYERLLETLAQRHPTLNAPTLSPEKLATTLDTFNNPVDQAAAAFVRQYYHVRFAPTASVTATRDLKSSWRTLKKQLAKPTHE